MQEFESVKLAVIHILYNQVLVIKAAVVLVLLFYIVLQKYKMNKTN